MFILLFPMGVGILAGTFGLRLMMRSVSDQRAACRFHKKTGHLMKNGATEEQGDEDGAGLIPIMPLVKKGLAAGLAVGVFMDVITYIAAGPLVKLSQRAGGMAGILACQNGSAPLQVALSLWGMVR